MGSELDVLGAEVLEETPALAEQDRHEVDLDLVEEPGPKHALRDPGPMHEYAPVARRVPGPADRLGEVAQVRDVRVVRERRRRLVPADDEDGHSIVVVALPPPAGSKVPLPARTAPVDMKSSMAARSASSSRSAADSMSPPPTQSWSRSPPSPRPLPGPAFGPAMKPSRDIDM